MKRSSSKCIEKRVDKVFIKKNIEVSKWIKANKKDESIEKDLLDLRRDVFYDLLDALCETPRLLDVWLTKDNKILFAAHDKHNLVKFVREGATQVTDEMVARLEEPSFLKNIGGTVATLVGMYVSIVFYEEPNLFDLKFDSSCLNVNKTLWRTIDVTGAKWVQNRCDLD